MNKLRPYRQRKSIPSESEDIETLTLERYIGSYNFHVNVLLINQLKCDIDY